MKIILLLSFALLTVITSGQSHHLIKDDDGKPLDCTKIIFVDADGKEKNIKCTLHSGCYIKKPCNEVETIKIFPEENNYYELVYEYPCSQKNIKISSKSVVNKWEKNAKTYKDKGEKKKTLLYYKNLAYTYNRNGKRKKALETEKQSYLILSELLLKKKGDSLIKIVNNELIVDNQLKQAIRKYQIKHNLKTKNGQFTYELAKSFKGNDSLLIKDKVFE